MLAKKRPLSTGPLTLELEAPLDLRLHLSGRFRRAGLQRTRVSHLGSHPRFNPRWFLEVFGTWEASLFRSIL